MVEKLPSAVSTFKVVGRLVRSVMDSEDSDTYPDVLPVVNANVVFTPMLLPPIFRVPTAAEPITVYQESVSAITDENGYLKVPTESVTGVELPWGFSPEIIPTGWTWQVTISGVGNFPDRVFAIAGSDGGVIDLATVIPVPPSPGEDIVEWQQVVQQVTSARDETLLAAASVSDIRDTIDTGRLSEDALNATIGAAIEAFDPGTPGDTFDPADFATAAQGTKADSAVQPDDPRIPVIMTQAAYDLITPVAGQVYIIQD